MSEVQEALYAMLLAFDRYCSARGLRYTLLAGTLLGAVRHKGFIPWDDDADLGMPRPDYQRLLTLRDDFYAQTGYRLSGHLGVPLAISPLCKVENPAIAVQPQRELAHQLLWLDVSPLDAMPDDDKELERECLRTHHHHAAINYLASTPASGRTRMRRALKYVGTPLRHIPVCKWYPSWCLTRIATALPWGSTNSVGSVSWGLSGVRERMDAARFEQFERMRFVDHDFMVMGSWEQYLMQTYGDTYLQVPAQWGRVTHLERAWYVDDGRPVTLSSGEDA